MNGSTNTTVRLPVWTRVQFGQHGGEVIRDDLRDFDEKARLAKALTPLAGRARAACVSLVDSLRPISFVERCKIVWATAKTFNVPRGHVTVTVSLRKSFPTRSSDDVMQMMTVL